MIIGIVLPSIVFIIILILVFSSSLPPATTSPSTAPGAPGSSFPPVARRTDWPHPSMVLDFFFVSIYLLIYLFTRIRRHIKQPLAIHTSLKLAHICLRHVLARIAT